MTPEDVTSWGEVVREWGPLGVFILAMFIFKLMGFIGMPNSKRANNSDTEERRQPVTVECPVTPALNGLREEMKEMVRQQGRMLEKQSEATAQLRTLVDLYVNRQESGDRERERIRTASSS